MRFVPGSAPLITAQPTGVASSADGTATFTVSSQGTPNLGYRWVLTNGVAVSGATGTSVSFNNVSTFQSGTVVSVVITNAYGTATSSNVTLNVAPNYFTGGNLAVVQMGTATRRAGADGEPVSVDQFTTSGTLSLDRWALPSTGPNAFILDNSATEGFLSRSPATTSIWSWRLQHQHPNSVPGQPSPPPMCFARWRRLMVSEITPCPITNANIYSTFNVRGAASDGSNFWVSGAGGTGASIANGELGIIYVGNPALETNVTVTHGNRHRQRAGGQHLQQHSFISPPDRAAARLAAAFMWFPIWSPAACPPPPAHW